MYLFKQRWFFFLMFDLFFCLFIFIERGFFPSTGLGMSFIKGDSWRGPFVQSFSKVGGRREIYFFWTLLWFSSQNAEEGSGEVFLLSFVCSTCFGLEWRIWYLCRKLFFVCWQPRGGQVGQPPFPGLMLFPGGSLGTSVGILCKYRVCAIPGPTFLEPWGTCNPEVNEIEMHLTPPPPHTPCTSKHTCFKLRKRMIAFGWIFFGICKQHGGTTIAFSFKLVSFGSEVDGGIASLHRSPEMHHC